MLKVLLGSKDKELVLQYLISKNEGYASKIARFFSLNPSQITKQLEFLENGDILVGIQVGRARFYKFNPKYYFLDELKALLIKARDAYRILKILKTNLCTTERLLVKKEGSLMKWNFKHMSTLEIASCISQQLRDNGIRTPLYLADLARKYIRVVNILPQI